MVAGQTPHSVSLAQNLQNSATLASNISNNLMQSPSGTARSNQNIKTMI